MVEASAYGLDRGSFEDKRMKALVFADLHARSFSAFSRPTEDGLGTRFREILDVLEKIVEDANARENGYDCVIIGGDVFDEKSRTPPLVVREVLLRLLDIEVPVIVATGNHDTISRVDNKTLLDVLKRWGNFTINSSVSIAGVLVVARACSPDLEKEHEVLESLNKDCVLVTHGLVRGVEEKIRFEEGLDVEILKKFRLSIVGDIHTPMFFPEDNLLIPGAPLHHNFGDVGREAVVWSVTVSKDNVDVSPSIIPGPRFRDVSPAEYAKLKNKKRMYFRVSGETEILENAILAPSEESAEIVEARGSITIFDDKKDLLEKWVDYKGLPEQVKADRLEVGKEILNASD